MLAIQIRLSHRPSKLSELQGQPTFVETNIRGSKDEERLLLLDFVDKNHIFAAFGYANRQTSYYHASANFCCL